MLSHPARLLIQKRLQVHFITFYFHFCNHKRYQIWLFLCRSIQFINEIKQQKPSLQRYTNTFFSLNRYFAHLQCLLFLYIYTMDTQPYRMTIQIIAFRRIHLLPYYLVFSLHFPLDNFRFLVYIDICKLIYRWINRYLYLQLSINLYV